jgi:TRAP-type C4-dicarboxylate transport system permease small subunit
MRALIDKILERTVLIVLGIMLLSVIWQVFSRYVLQSPSTLTDEISSYSLIWFGLLGAAYASGKHLHLAIDLLPEKLVERKGHFFNSVVYISVICFAFLVMVIGGIRLVQLSFQFEQTSATLEIPLGFIYMVVPFSGLIICYYNIDTLISSLKAKSN